MCYHTSTTGTANGLKSALQAPFPQEDQLKIHFHANGFAHPDLAVLSVHNGRSIQLYNWGLIPSWVKTWQDAAKFRNQTLNAKSETVFEKPAFKDSILKRRCIVPVTGFYEWKHHGKEKIPHFIHPKEQPFFYLAGIYAFWTDPATRDAHITFSILTGEANTLMADIHNSAKRMPLMIDRRNIDAWISNDLPKAGIEELMHPCDDRDMAAYTVSKDLSNPKVNSDIDSITRPVRYEV